MKQMITLSIVLCSLLFGTVSTQALPARPQDPQHPASSEYPFKSSRQTLKIAGRNVDVYLPTLDTNQGSFPAIVFGHGQAIDVEGYDLTFKHFAQKGIAVIHPMFDSGFFDQDWRRMAKDFNDLTAATLEKLSDKINSNQIIYAGHSKGGYIALMAAGAPESKVKVKSLVLFAPAGFDADYLKAVDVEMPVTLAWSDGDTVIKQSLIQDIYNRLPSRKNNGS